LSACIGAPDGGGLPDDKAATAAEGLGIAGSKVGATTLSNPSTPSATRVWVGSIVAPFPTVKYVAPPPVDADLRPDGAMRFYGADPSLPTEGLQIDVMNVGTDPAYGPSGRLSINGSVFNTALYQYGGTATAPNTLNPGERGYLTAEIPYGFVQDCQPYAVQIDLDQTMQSGPNVFANDTRAVLAYETGVVCPLGWSAPINAANLGQVAEPHEDGKSLQDIVSSVEIARLDGNRCSHCHNNTGAHAYQPDVAPDAISSPLIDAFQPSGGSLEGPVNWACGGNPWSQQFIAQPLSVKPQYLKDALQKWLTDGTLP
jgi:hypothetical protein